MELLSNKHLASEHLANEHLDNGHLAIICEELVFRQRPKASVAFTCVVTINIVNMLPSNLVSERYLFQTNLSLPSASNNARGC